MYYERNDKTKITKNMFLWSIIISVLISPILFNIAIVNAGESADTILVSTGDAADVPDGERIPVFNAEEDFGIRNALAMLGSLCQKNIVPSQGVDGQLAFRTLRDVTFEEAMDAILGENFVYEEQGNLVKVYTKAEYKSIKEDPERMIYKVFTLYYISAAEAMKLIAPVLSDIGTIQSSTPAETIVPTGESISTGSSGGDTMALNDTIVVKDYPENIDEAQKLLSELDIRPKQVLVEATILSATLTESMKLGVDLNLWGGVSITGTSASAADAFNNAVSAQTPIGQVASQSGVLPGTPIETTGFASIDNGLRIGITTGDMAAIITALESVTDTTVLANPKILAVNKQLGQVYIGTKIGYQSQTTQTNESTTQEVDFLETGTKLSFRPYIGDNGYIRMDISPKDSSGTLKENNIPDESSAELSTNIFVKDGQTIVIGGLFRDVVVTSRSQVPLLGDIPIVGVVFRGSQDTVQRQEVIVLLTPHIIEDPEDIMSDGRVDDVSRKRFGAQDGLQSIGRAKMAEDHYVKAVSCYMQDDNSGAMKELQIALTLRPSYLEAIRLKERIIAEVSPTEIENLKRVMIDSIDQQEAQNWQRR